MKRILHIACLLSLIIVSGCSKSSSGTYEGYRVRIKRYGGSAQMTLILNENKNILTGTLTLSGNRWRWRRYPGTQGWNINCVCDKECLRAN